MAKHVACLRGWHPALARAEIAALLPSSTITRIDARRLVLVESDESPAEIEDAIECSSGCQAVLFDAILWPISDGIEGFLDAVGAYLTASPRHGSAAVRAWRHEGKVDGVRPSQLAGSIGGLLSASNYVIDLEHPDHRLGLVVDASSMTLACGWMIGTGDDSDGISARRATDRPFFKPVSLDPRLARLAVNLASGPRCNGATLDLMTGTGGFAIEAALSGRSVFAIDLDPVMIAGAQQNLDWASAQNPCTLLQGDATNLAALLPSSATVAGFVLDPPYGRNSQGSLEPEHLIEAVLESSRQVAQAHAAFVLIVPIQSHADQLDEAIQDEATIELLHGNWHTLSNAFAATGWRIQGRWVEHVHASLSRLIVHAVIAPQD